MTIRKAMPWLGGAAVGAVCTALACWGLYGAPLNQPMTTSSDGWGERGVRYVVGKKRFDWFYPSHGPAGYHSNCWGGHTLDGRCISMIWTPGVIQWGPATITGATKPSLMTYQKTAQPSGISKETE